MMKKLRILSLIVIFALSGCKSTSVDSSGNPINRSLLLDTGLKFGGNIPVLPFPLPELDLGFRINFRRPTIQEEVDLNLSKVGKWRGQESAPPSSSPKPFPLVDSKKE